MSRHASLEDLASFIEGILKPRKSGKIASHLAGCSLCSGHVQDLQQVPVMLANTAYPPIPDQLSVRIEAAIASESVTRVAVQPAAGQPGTAGAVSGEAGRRDLPERSRPGRRRWRMPGFSSPLAGSLAAVAAAVIVAGGGYEIASHTGSANTASPSSSAAHGAASPAAPAAGRAVAGPLRNGPALNVRQAGQTRSISSIETNTNFVPGGLQAQAQAALRAERVSKLKAAGELPSPYARANAAGGVTSAQLSKCVSNVAAGRQVLLVDIARYQGKAARIIVVGTPPNGPGTIYAVGASCSSSNRDILAQQPLPAPSP